MAALKARVQQAEGDNQDARRLLVEYINREESMEVFGFDVVIRMSKMPKRKKKNPA